MQKSCRCISVNQKIIKNLILELFFVTSRGRGLSAWSLHVLPVHAWVLTGYSGFLPQSKNMTVRLIGLSKLPLDVNECVHGCLSCMSLCCPAMDWQPVQGVPCLSPVDCWR
ncbi:hypothetical protein CHARACLAT_029711 [Characodon lateralis]|uniref:4Fe-4S ferredoxin-type domain-containing protein n=1 Tax=Characodon lateralis TaxID=208331 RepID=A0ABU7F7G2_9TELE|nr:hypothetical protein [Characodon lateralis]